MRRIEGNVPARDAMMSETKRSQLPQVRTCKYNVNAKVDTNLRHLAVAKIAPPSPPPPPAAAEPERRQIYQKPVSKGADFICYEVSQRMNARLDLNRKTAAAAATVNNCNTAANFHNIQRLAQAKNVPKFEREIDPRMQPVDLQKRARGCEIARLRMQTRVFDDPNVDLKSIPAAVWNSRLRLIYYEKCGGLQNDAHENSKLAVAREIMQKEYGREIMEEVGLDIAEVVQDKSNTYKAVEKKHRTTLKNEEVANADCQKAKAIAKKNDIEIEKPNVGRSTHKEDILQPNRNSCNSEKGKHKNKAYKMPKLPNMVQQTKSKESCKKDKNAADSINDKN